MWEENNNSLWEEADNKVKVLDNCRNSWSLVVSIYVDSKLDLDFDLTVDNKDDICRQSDFNIHIFDKDL